MPHKAIITCALTGVLTDPRQHPVPVTPEEMAREARRAFDAGACVMHVHFRQQEPGKGHLPSWEAGVGVAIMQAIRDACPGVILNQSTGTRGPDIRGPLDCLRAIKPEVEAYLDVMAQTGTQPEFECFDTGIVRCVEMYARNGMFRERPRYNFVMGVESGMPADPDLLPILRKLALKGARWQ